MKKARYYKKKPIPVLAREWNGEERLDQVPRGVIHDVYETLNFTPTRQYTSYCALLDTPEGHMTIGSGDMIMGPGAEGEFWSIKKSIFEKTYEPEFQDEPEDIVIEEYCACGLFYERDCECTKGKL